MGMSELIGGAIFAFIVLTLLGVLPDEAAHPPPQRPKRKREKLPPTLGMGHSLPRAAARFARWKGGR